MRRIILTLALALAFQGSLAGGQTIYREVYIALHSLVTNPGHIQYYVFHTLKEAKDIGKSLVASLPISKPCSASVSPCGGGSVCTTGGGKEVTCTCPPGYNETYKLIPNIKAPVMVPYTKTNCTDVNECLGNSTICGIHTKSCINLPGTYNCTCKTGYMLVPPKKCIKYDPCYYMNCHNNATCANDTGSWHCKCKTGYSGNGTMCKDTNECASVSTNNCSVNAACTNHIGGFSCACNKGFSGNGVTCRDINECAANTHVCSPHGTCYNTIGSYNCRCNTGYTGDGKTCTDINECKTLGGNCTRYSVCVNTPGSYNCNCKKGFVKNASLCQDVNECTNGQSNCHKDATCTNYIGSYSCKCKYPGFAGNGTWCTAIATLCNATTTTATHLSGSTIKPGTASAVNGNPAKLVNKPSSSVSLHWAKSHTYLFVTVHLLVVIAIRALQ